MKKLPSHRKVAIFVALWIGWSQPAVAEMVLSAGSHMQDSSELASNAIAAEIAISAPLYGPLRHSVSFAGMTRSESGYAENRFGYYLGYRHLLTDRVFIEPQAGLVYLRHSKQQVEGPSSTPSRFSSWDTTSGHAQAFGIVAGYRPGPRTEVMLSARRFRSDMKVRQRVLECLPDCDDPNAVYNPYAGLETPMSVGELNNRTVISLSAGMLF